MTARIEPQARSGAVVPLRVALSVLVVAGALAVVPLWAPLVLAAWTAELCEPLARRWARRFGSRERAGVVLTVLLVLVILLPLTVLGVSLVIATADLLSQMRQSKGASDVLRLFIPSEVLPSLTNFGPRRLLDLVRRHGPEALGTVQAVFGALSASAIGAVVYVFGFYECVANGPRGFAWLRDRSLVSRPAFSRLSDAFVETGRGLFIGIGGTALLQGAVATVGYVVVGVPYPLLFGSLTVLAALIPTIGTALVWVPITVLLFATDRTVGGVVLAVLGCFAAVVDNFVRPWLSRYGELQLPTFVTFVAMLGGIVIFGGFGLVLGPLFVRLAKEALDIWRDRRRADEA